MQQPRCMVRHLLLSTGVAIDTSSYFLTTHNGDPMVHGERPDFAVLVGGCLPLAKHLCDGTASTHAKGGKRTVEGIQNNRNGWLAAGPLC